MIHSTSGSGFPHIGLIIAGAQKAGTTSLKEYLGEHPQLYTHSHKEFGFFVDNDEYSNGYERALQKYFPDRSLNKVLIAKSAGFYTYEKALKRLKADQPDCKLILILRNPVERTYSAFLMEKNNHSFDDSVDLLKELIKKEDWNDWRYEFLIGMSLYDRQLELVYRYFPKEQLKIIRYEELNNNPLKVCRLCFEWLGVDPEFIPDTGKRYNETRKIKSTVYGRFITSLLKRENFVKKMARIILPGQTDHKLGEFMRKTNLSNQKYEEINPKISELLHQYFKPHNEKLSSITGIDFSDWNN